MNCLPSEGCKCVLCVVLSLPNVLQNALFCEWLDLFDLGRLDSAVCNNAHRDDLLTAWKDDHCVMEQSSTTNIVVSESLAVWVGSRHIKIGTNIAIPEFFAETEASKAFFKATGNTLKGIKYPEKMSFQAKSTQSNFSMQSMVERASMCPNLDKISIDYLNMKNVSLRAVLNNCTKLKLMILGFPEDINFQELSECGQYIEYLHVVGYRSESVIPPESVVLSKTNTMKKLHCVFNTGNCDQLVEYICSNVGLRELRVDHVSTQDMWKILKACTELITLRLDFMGNNSFTDSNIPRLIKLCKNLRNFKLIDIDFADSWLLSLLRGCAHLQTLHLWDFFDFDGVSQDASISGNIHPAGAGPPLIALHVKSIAAPVLAEVLRSYPSLTNLGIGHSTVESFDAALRVLEDYEMTELHLTVPRDYTYHNIHLLRDLSSLHLYECRGLVNEHTLTIAHNNPHLTVLHLVGAEVNNDGVIALVKVCQQLTALFIYAEYFCDQDKSLNKTLKSLCPSLVTVDVRL